MKNTLVATLLLASCGYLSYAQNNVTVKGQIKGVESGRLYMLAPVSENRVDTLGTALFQAPDFVLEGKCDEPVVAHIVVENYSGGFPFMAEPGGSYTALLTNGREAYIRGGKLQDAWTGYLKYSAEQRQKISAMKQRHQTLVAENKYRSASALNDSILLLEQRARKETYDFLGQHDDLITAHTYLENAQMRDAGAEQCRKMYESLGEGAKQTPSARILKERYERMEQTEKGRLAPDFTLTTPEGMEVTLSKVAGKVKILDFWASWCGPCRLNNPALKKAYEEYHDKGLEIISVSLDNKPERWKDAIAKDGLTWINVSSLKGWKCDVARLYSVSAVPAIFILNEENRIVATNLRGEKLAKYLEDNLK